MESSPGTRSRDTARVAITILLPFLIHSRRLSKITCICVSSLVPSRTMKTFSLHSFSLYSSYVPSSSMSSLPSNSLRSITGKRSNPHCFTMPLIFWSKTRLKNLLYHSLQNAFKRVVLPMPGIPTTWTIRVSTPLMSTVSSSSSRRCLSPQI